MARITKHSTCILKIIKHNTREFKDGICHSNEQVDLTRSKDNYSLIRRGSSAKEINNYRKQIEKKCFKYNRKNLIHANEIICTLPSDCPPEQEKLFFDETFKYICSTLPMGEECVFIAEVHCDEGRVSKNGKIVVNGAKHLHVMYVPAVPDTKHDDYEYKLCSDQLTKRAILKNWHSKYQQWMNKAGVNCTVVSGATTGRGISVKALKEISQTTGLSLDQIMTLQKENKLLYEKIAELEICINKKESEIDMIQKELSMKIMELEQLHKQHTTTYSWGDITYDKENDKLW